MRKIFLILASLLSAATVFAGPVVVMPSSTSGYIASSGSGSSSDILPVVTEGAACTASPSANTGIRADYTAVLTCNGGVWAVHEAAWWRAPVASYASLPATGNVIGEARITTDTGRAFTWNGASWIPLAIDQNGNFSVPGNMSVTGTSTFTGAATFNSSLTVGDGTAANATNTLVVNRTATEGAACSPNGAVARDATGLILSCQSGVWKKASGGWSPTTAVIRTVSSSCTYQPDCNYCIASVSCAANEAVTGCTGVVSGKTCTLTIPPVGWSCGAAAMTMPVYATCTK